MSRNRVAGYDRDVGCCSCLGFLMKSWRGMSSSCTEEDHEFLIDDEGVNGYKGNVRSLKRSSSFPAQNRAICRLNPVKVTTNLTRGQDADGNKMINEYVRVCNIGSGSYGKVVLYQSKNDGKQYAIKAFYKSRLSKVHVTSFETAMTDVRREVSIMKLLEHPNLVNLVEVIDDSESDRFYMVLEYVEGKWICDASGTCGGIGETTARKYLRDIIAGLMYLHSHDIVHGDIKPENLLVTGTGSVKIGDFSVSQALEDDDEDIWRSPGTPVFTAPECCLGFSYNGKAADAWALGITLYCMILGKCPFIGESLQDTYDKIVNRPLCIPEELDPELKDLLERLLSKDPRHRLTLDAAAEHPWVVRVDGPIPRSLCRCKNTTMEEEDNSSDAEGEC
ncbi:serine/threonine-protein kinase GRIK1-like [Asparagus officinalis]|uniref:serine/threonine-protein kinase GRIK1-like n=1 Tax=Asparagus officinalis TaxID=4686 RepID=UPI00098DEF38|nr:serine/threonine-protein kinase GRIK1-like [Asparagus officinalis]